MRQHILCALLLFGAATLAQAHFVFVVADGGGKSAKVFISEVLQPDGGVDPGLISGARLWVRDADGHETPAAMTRADDAYRIQWQGSPRLIHGVADLGLTQRAGGKPHLLLYYPKTILGDPLAGGAAVGEAAPVEIVPVGEAGALRLRLLAHGKPAANAEVTVILPDGAQKKVRTGESGETEAFSQAGRYGAWARFWEPAEGERDGKKYEELRHYATLVFDAPAVRFAPLPRATSSFGAVADGGWLYVYGGHVAPTHTYSTEAVSGEFVRLKLSTPGPWERLPEGPRLQGLNLAAHGGKIYRIGGMTPRNAPGTAADNHSLADCARFDPATRQWEALPPLPEPRSSHDVVVVGDTLIVSGGWNLRGKAGETWADTILMMDLTAGKLEWKAAPQPFRRRALIAAAHDGRMFAMGGIDAEGAVSAEVNIYNPATGLWTKGPTLPGAGMNTFAPAACVHRGRLYVSLADGVIHRLDESTRRWIEAGRATPRIAHRMAPAGDRMFVIGGASGGANLDRIDAVEPAQTRDRP
ncbi:MAG: hypothetical protein JSU00_15830 [Acidobacteria bacterium]|nr:hypothetical protein [Acidobacteriota bacterium]